MEKKILIIIASLFILILVSGFYFIFFRKNSDEVQPQNQNKSDDQVAQAKVSSNENPLYSPSILKQISNTSLDSLIKSMKSLKQSGVIYKGKDNYEAKIISTAVVVYHCYKYFENENYIYYMYNDHDKKHEVKKFKEIISDLFVFLSIRRKQGEQKDLIDSLAKKYNNFIDFLPSTNTSYSGCSSVHDFYMSFKHIFKDFEKYLVVKEKIKTDNNETLEVETLKVVLYNIRKGLLKYGNKNQ